MLQARVTDGGNCPRMMYIATIEYLVEDVGDILRWYGGTNAKFSLSPFNRGSTSRPYSSLN